MIAEAIRLSFLCWLPFLQAYPGEAVRLSSPFQKVEG